MTNKSIVITILGFAGFIFASFLFFYNRGDTKSLFHEIKYDPNNVAWTRLKEKRDSVSNKIDIEIKLRDSLTEKIEKKDKNLKEILGIQFNHESCFIYSLRLVCFWERIFCIQQSSIYSLQLKRESNTIVDLMKT